LLEIVKLAIGTLLNFAAFWALTVPESK